MKRIILLSCLAVLFACTGSKEVSSPEPVYPNWVSNRPFSSDFYIGIAKALKSNPDYQALAKQNALADLSSEISVKLSSESIFHQIDKGDTYREEYQALIQVESNKKLEGYTSVASWESDTEYWTYYQLSKVEWKRIRAQRKQKALEQAYGYYVLALDHAKENRTVPSINNAIKALDALRMYLDEPLKHPDLEAPLDALCFEFLAQAQASISFEVKQGVQHQERILMGNNGRVNSFEVFVQKPNLPFKVRSTFKNAPEHTNSNENGFLQIETSGADVYRKDHFVQFTFDWEGVLRDANASNWLRTLLDFPEKSFKISLTALMPKIAITSTELNLGEALSQKNLLHQTSNFLKDKGFDIVEDAEADYLIYIKSNTHRGLTNNRMHTAILQYEFEVKNKQQKLVYKRQEMELKGVQASFPTAGVNAYERSVDEFRWDVLRGFLKYLEGK